MTSVLLIAINRSAKSYIYCVKERTHENYILCCQQIVSGNKNDTHRIDSRIFSNIYDHSKPHFYVLDEADTHADQNRQTHMHTHARPSRQCMRPPFIFIHSNKNKLIIGLLTLTNRFSNSMCRHGVCVHGQGAINKDQWQQQQQQQ